MSEPTYTDTLEDLVLALVKHLVGKGEADVVETALVEVVDPVYERLSARDPMMKLLFLCERIRGVT